MYTLIDGIDRNQKNPNTFQIPSKQDKSNLKVGDHVKLGFEDVEGTERMWVKINHISGDHFVGFLDNDPSFLKSIRHKDLVEFNSKHILSIL